LDGFLPEYDGLFFWGGIMRVLALSKYKMILGARAGLLVKESMVMESFLNTSLAFLAATSTCAK
jgi:hypothetical protein